MVNFRSRKFYHFPINKHRPPGPASRPPLSDNPPPPMPSLTSCPAPPGPPRQILGPDLTPDPSDTSGGRGNGAASLRNSFLQHETYTHHGVQDLPSSAFIPEKQGPVHAETCTQVFTAVLLVITRTWKQPEHPSKGGSLSCGTSTQRNRTQQ